MISIQDLGMQILGNNPKNFYIFGGQEYGVKFKYIDHLVKLFGPIISADSVNSLLDQMHRRQIIPLDKGVYVVRYDESFISSLDAATVKTIETAKIPGVIVCLYENLKHVAKCDKFLPDYTASIDKVNPKFIMKYLHEDFPKLDDRSIEVAVKASTSYGHARCICSAMNYADLTALARMPEAELMSLFGCDSYTDESELRSAIGSKNFIKLLKCAQNYAEDLNRILYTILQCMIEFDKIKSSKYSDSDLKPFANSWTREDIYYMFMHTYNELSRLRSMSSYNVEDSLIYLFSIISFQHIPALEAI